MRDECSEHGALFILDEMITGFRWHSGGAQTLYGIEPDLSTFGKALGNGFAVSALLGKRRFMERGGLNTNHDRVFLLSTTHGAESVGLAAACAVAAIYQREPIVERLDKLGNLLATSVREVVAAAGLSDYIQVVGRSSNLVFITLDAHREPSQEFRTLFLQELLLRGILAPSFVVSAALTEDDIARTAEAVAGAVVPYARGLEQGVGGVLPGRPVRPTLRRRA